MSLAGTCARVQALVVPKTAHKRCARSMVATRATFHPGFGMPAEDPQTPKLHGVLHSCNLPEMLAETVGLYDARDAIETCSGLYGDEKESCYAIFGVDPAADAWFSTVQRLEDALNRDTDPDEEAYHHGRERC